MAGFIQIIEFRTSRIDEIQALADERSDQLREGSTAHRVTITADRDRPGYYLTIAEFDSYESAMENSNRPETSEFAAQMAKLCDGPPTFYNLDVRQVME
jgi:quinol monooxygenase YgiN